jgi:TonB family protein
MTMLLVKVTLLFAAGLVALLTMRRASAAMRHLLCVCALTGSLILPVAALLPAKSIAVRLAPITAAMAGSRAIGRSPLWPSSNVLLELWAIGTALLLLRLGIGYWRIRRVVRSADALAPGLYTADVGVPIATGLLRPVVLLPRDAPEWPDWQRGAAVRHERAHVERGDLGANFVAHLACAVYWFHPLAWILSSVLHREQETACDDAVLHSGFEPATYAEALLAVAQNPAPNLITGCAMTTQIDVKSRIMRLLDRSIVRTTSTRTLRCAAVAFAGLVLAIAIPVLAQEPYHVGGDVSSPSVLQKVDPEYTEAARAAKISGPVVLSMTIGVDGMAHDISVVRGLDSGLDLKAVEAVQKWHFNPGIRKGEPVPVLATVEINFRLQ